MLRVEPYKTEHYLQIQSTDDFGCIAALALQEWAVFYEQAGSGITLFDSTNTPILSVGIVRFWPGVYQLWMRLAPQIVGHLKEIRRILLQHLEIACNAFSIHRIQTYIKKDFVQGHRWAKSFGFKPEACLEQYSPDRADYIQYVLIKERPYETTHKCCSGSTVCIC